MGWSRMTLELFENSELWDLQVTNSGMSLLVDLLSENSELRTTQTDVVSLEDSVRSMNLLFNVTCL